ncbi:hypothetical protein [Kitasatospora sp. GP82]|uniref:hypothetical protein n=1 Tax=Kitasatospora sp. GP82 TaxID=3035089 RepID=UPI002474932A|nr:hypothetical protein [Kitasatospora sp. GP82]
MYSYDVAATHRPSATTPRSIPGMRPSCDAEHPSSPTPIYDTLYSEYRRLFRALPGDRTGEEDLRFTGFAVRDGHFGRDSYPVRQALPPAPGDSYGPRGEPYGSRPELGGYPPQHQAFDTFPGHAQGTPQFMPNQQGGGSGQYGTGYLAAGQVTSGQFTAGQFTAGQFASGQIASGQIAPAQSSGGQYAGGQYPGAPQASGGQGWVASGYLAPAQPVATAVGVVPEPGGVGGRHRSMLSLPPGRTPGQG